MSAQNVMAIYPTVQPWPKDQTSTQKTQLHGNTEDLKM